MFFSRLTFSPPGERLKILRGVSETTIAKISKQILYVRVIISRDLYQIANNKLRAHRRQSKIVLPIRKIEF